ncbi:MAG: ATP-dependent DNA helicase RecG [Alphaproteobacteria bacterium]|nr:ATP-dependent DNA helicase RecG [Alphaproteobacteria bacterium]
MRPTILFPLFAPVDSLPGLGPRLAPLVAKRCGPLVADLIWHLPKALVDRRYRPTVAEAETGRIATVTVTIDAHEPPAHRRQPYKIRAHDSSGAMAFVYFTPHADWLKKQLPVGSLRIVSGLVETFRDGKQITHPDLVLTPEQADQADLVEPVYGLTEGLPAKSLRRSLAAALDRLPALPEWLDPAWRARNAWPDWAQALRQAHAPQSDADLAPTAPARCRLAYDELLANQLALALVRERRRRRAGRVLRGDGRHVGAIQAALPFALTASQDQAIGEIAADMASGGQMLRLLQGDVGSGKTVVALLAMATAVEAGCQAALMAPTEILARQHMATIEPLAAAAGLRAALLTGREKGKARDALLAGLDQGAIDIVIGTHALVQDGVGFRDLGLAVVDEQHRFGVHQRMQLAAKGPMPDDEESGGEHGQARPAPVHTLVMSATPIPRSLLLTAYGDIEVSRLLEKPAGRKPVDTRTLPIGRLDEVVAGIGRAIARGDKAYWVCPLVEESEDSDLAAASERYAALEQVFPGKVGLVHGRMKGGEKDKAMAAFAGRSEDGTAVAPGLQTQVLVATTVIEVGVDVPQATVIVIEHAERFGMAQLHQLRGRVGRGSAPSSCVLLYAPPLGETARARLEVLRDTDDGFRIAEEDLRLRGGGELLGTRQSGLPQFRVADWTAHGDLMAAARDDAKMIVETDPRLRTARGQALRHLLYLFQRDSAVRTLDSG